MCAGLVVRALRDPQPPAVMQASCRARPRQPRLNCPSQAAKHRTCCFLLEGCSQVVKGAVGMGFKCKFPEGILLDIIKENLTSRPVWVVHRPWQPRPATERLASAESGLSRVCVRPTAIGTRAERQEQLPLRSDQAIGAEAQAANTITSIELGAKHHRAGRASAGKFFGEHARRLWRIGGCHISSNSLLCFDMNVKSQKEQQQHPVF